MRAVYPECCALARLQSAVPLKIFGGDNLPIQRDIRTPGITDGMAFAQRNINLPCTDGVCAGVGHVNRKVVTGIPGVSIGNGTLNARRR